MAFADIERAVVSRMRDNWIETPLAIDNDEYEPDGSVAAWVRLAVRHGSSINAALGAAIVAGPGMVRRPGQVIVQVFVRRKAGATRAQELADLVSDLFQNRTFSGVRCYETSSITVGERNGWFQLNAQTFFAFDEVIAA